MEELGILVPHYSVRLSSPQAVMKHSQGSQQEVQPSAASKVKAFLPILRFQHFLILQLEILLQLLHLFKGIFFSYFCLGDGYGPTTCPLLWHARLHEKQAEGKQKI